MAKEERFNKLITFGLIIVIIIAVGTIVFINLQQFEKKETDQNGSENTPANGYVNIIYNEKTYNYSIDDLSRLDSVTGSGSYIKLGWLPDVVIDGPFNYTGIKITSLLDNIENLPDVYNITVKASDGRNTTYNYDEIIGNVSIYNNSGNITGSGGVTMILAYMHDGEYISDPGEGLLRIAFIDDGSITSSKLWTKLVVSIEVNNT